MPMPPVYNIWVRGIKKNRSGQATGLINLALVTDYVKLEFKMRYNDVGGWTLLMRNGIEAAQLLRQQLSGSSTDPAGTTSSGQGYGGITVVRNGTIVFSGPVRGFVATSDENDGAMIEFHGIDDTGYLSSRVAMVPNVSGPANRFIAPSGQGWGFWIFPPGSAIRSTTEVMFNLVTFNIGPDATYNNPPFQNRSIPFLTVPQPSGYGPPTKVRTRYQGLLEKCQELATYIPLNPQDPNYNPNYNGLQFSITQQTDGTLLFNYGPPNDFRKSVIFFTGDQDLHIGGNIGTYQYGLDAPTVNYSIIAGQGEAAARFFAHRGAQFQNSAIGTTNSVATYGLWEGFLDRRDIQYTDPVINPSPPPAGNTDYLDMLGEFIRAMDGQLREQGEITLLDVTVINNSPTEYFVDYNIGDFVTCRIEGQEIVGQVMDVTVTLTKDEGEVVTPVIGTQVIGSTTRLFNEIYRGQKKNELLETGM